MEGGSDGVLLPPRVVSIEGGTNRIDLGYVEDAYRTLFRVSLTPMRPFEVEMAEVPPTSVLASADLNGVPLRGTVAFTLVSETKRDVLLEDAGKRMREEWPTVIASLALSFIMLGLIGHQRGCPGKLIWSATTLRKGQSRADNEVVWVGDS